MENLTPYYQDSFGRKFRSLRIGLTQACNFQCIYCVPKGFSLKKLPTELGANDLFFLTNQLIKACGIKKIRLTGGEPFLYQDLEKFLLLTSKLPVVKSITTNGLLLEKNLFLLKKAGYQKINVSLDSLNLQNFQTFTLRKGLKKVLNAIEKACQLNFQLKINVVPMKSLNEDQILPLLDFCLDLGIECRYIELMKMGHVNGNFFEKYFFSMKKILTTIKKKYSFTPAPKNNAAETAKRFLIANRGYFGIIPNHSEPFCKDCDRLRLISNGNLYGCISNTKHHCLTNLLHLSPKESQEKLTRILPIAMQSKQRIFAGTKIYMQEIGG